MKYRDENGVFQDLYLPPTGDTLPIGSEVDYDGETVPYGWEEVTNYASYNLVTDGQEVKAGYKIDGKDVYLKRFTLPNLNQSTAVAHGLTNFELIDINVMTLSGGTYRKLNYTTSVYYIIDVDSTYITLYTSGSLTGTGKITLTYIKTT